MGYTEIFLISILLSAYFCRNYIREWVKGWIVSFLGEILLSASGIKKKSGSGETNGSKFSINANRLSAAITYEYRGSKYIINIPYYPNKISTHLEFEVFLILNGKKINITQQNGTSYLVTARQLGGESIEIYQDENLYKKLDLDEIPEF